MTKKEEFDLATKAFSLMTSTEQGIALTIFKHHKETIIEAWIDSIHKVCKGAINLNG